MRTARQAEALGKRIERETPTVRVTGYRKQDGGYAVDCVDTITGGAFVVWSTEDWRERRERNEA